MKSTIDLKKEGRRQRKRPVPKSIAGKGEALYQQVVQILKDEIIRMYQEVAGSPESTFHFFHGREAAELFGYAPDFFHPNNLSYKNWAEAFWLPIQETLN